ncbi:MAG: hypothetical protein NXY57DRAFT_966151 [Lentinula lateritia]|nr:MAG: hypothetical protein NXY57DRAFT_966151 [Lentinula lateritia]
MKDLVHEELEHGGSIREPKGHYQPVPKKDPTAAPSKSKKLKLSTVRKNEMMGLPLDAPLGIQLFDTKRLKDMRTLEQKNRLLSWAKTFCDKHLKRSLHKDRKLKRRKGQERTLPAKVAEYMHSMIEHVTSLRVEIQMLKTGLPPPLRPRVPLPISAPPLTTPVPTVNNSLASITAGHVLPLKVWTTDTGLQMPASSAAIGASPGDSITPTHANNGSSFSNAQTVANRTLILKALQTSLNPPTTPPNPPTTPPNPPTTPPNPPTTPPHPLMNTRGFMCLQLGSEELFTIRNVTSANLPQLCLPVTYRDWTACGMMNGPVGTLRTVARTH